jgi:hypothetical protein
MKSTKKAVRVHIRRCHLCSGVTEAEGALVERCRHCGKTMAPFYFFNEVEVQPWSEAEMRMPVILNWGERKPVRGLTAVW